ncbi:hypothetical protein [Candidatus Hodgkinia cicadicola]
MDFVSIYLLEVWELAGLDVRDLGHNICILNGEILGLRLSGCLGNGW